MAPRAVAALAAPRRRLVLILGGFLAVLPILGLWMLPLGLALMSDDVPWLKVPLEKRHAASNACGRVSAAAATRRARSGGGHAVPARLAPPTQHHTRHMPPT